MCGCGIFSLFLSLPSCISQPWQAACAEPEAALVPAGGSRRQGAENPWGGPARPPGPTSTPVVHAQLSGVGYSHQQPLQLPRKLCAGLKPPFPCLSQLSRDWSLLPFSKGNAQSDLTNQFDQENTLEKLKLSICGGPCTSFVLITHRARQNTNNQLTHPWS